MNRILLFFIILGMGVNANSQDWLDREMYPFESNYIALDHGSMHYVDEGTGEVILFVHGTPTWSFLYRDLIKNLSASYRCIAIDHIGFGLSEKPIDFEGTPQVHAAHLSAFIEKMDLQNITIVVHDFGGPIGLSSAIVNSTRIKQVVLFNTWLWETKSNPDAKKVDKILNGWMGRFLYLSMNFSPKVLLKKGFYDKSHLSKDIHKHYIKPFPNKDSRLSLLRIGQSLFGSSDWYQQQWESMDVLVDKPWLILWGTKDEFITTSYLEKWENRLPNAQVHRLDCGHFVQEEQAEEVLLQVLKFLSH